MKQLFWACTLALVGCAAPRVYLHPTKSEADFNRDSYDCEMDARRRAADVGAPNNPLLLPDYYHDCMTRKHGYTTAPPPAKP